MERIPFYKRNWKIIQRDLLTRVKHTDSSEKVCAAFQIIKIIKELLDVKFRPLKVTRGVLSTYLDEYIGNKNYSLLGLKVSLKEIAMTLYNTDTSIKKGKAWSVALDSLVLKNNTLERDLVPHNLSSVASTKAEKLITYHELQDIVKIINVRFGDEKTATKRAWE